MAGGRGRRWRAVLAWAAAAVVPLAPALAERADLLRAHGIRPLPAAQPAPGFSLPALRGGERSLADFRGDWVVLTFFATWCGPCRHEMPTLEQLHRAGADTGVQVVAVSVDSRRDPVSPFVQQLGLSFPVLWDHDGTVGRTYRATSIPVSYLIDRQGHAAGVAVGSRDWSRSLELFAALDGTPSAAAPTAAGAPPLELPASPPPTADWSLPDGPQRPGKPFTLEVRLGRPGTLDESLLQPPVLELPEGVRQQTVTAASSSAAGGRSVVYRIELVADRPGRYALDPIELRYSSPGGGPQSTLVEGPTVEVAPAGAGARPWVAGAVAVALAGGALWWRHRRRAPAGAPSPEARHAELERQLAVARGQRLAGEPAAAFESLAELARELESEQERHDLERQREAVRFGGAVPSSGQLEAVERRLARALARHKPDPDRELRRRLRLAGKQPAISKETPG